MSFTPANGDHAVETMTFTVRLAQVFTAQALNAVRSAHKKWRDELPAVATPKTVDVQIDGTTGVPQVNTRGALEFSFLRPNGTAAWSVKLLNADLLVECSRYTRWAKTWARARRYIVDMLEIVDGTEAKPPVVLLALVVNDRFRAEAGKGDLHELLRAGRYIPPFVFEAGPSWHQHFGWFETAQDVQVLNNANLDAQRELGVLETGGSETSADSIVVQHLQEWRMHPMGINDLLADGAKQLDRAMEYMHTCNKTLMEELLTNSMLEQVGLKSRRELAR